MKDEFIMGLRSIKYRKKQYVSLFLVCIFGVSISLFCLFMIKGMISSFTEKAKIYYGGDFQLVGENYSLRQNKREEIFPILQKVFPEGTLISPRFNFDADTSVFYFEGTQSTQRKIKGIDFDIEKNLFKTFNYIEGSSDEIKGTNGVLLSLPIAQDLQVHVGDEVLFKFKNDNGYIDTVVLVIKGIFKDSSFFGMSTSYMDREFLLKCLNISSSVYNRVCIILPENLNTKAIEYYKKLEELLPMAPFTNDSKDFYDKIWAYPMPTYALITLQANMDELQIVIDAMKLIAAFVIVILITIIVAGVSSTFRVIVMKRINEIGIYKAIGMKRQKIMGMLLVETMLLLLFGCLVGFLVSLLLCKGISLINFSFIPAFDIFLANGYLAPIISGGYIFIICCLVIVTTLISVLFSIRKSVSITPCQALAATE